MDHLPPGLGKSANLWTNKTCYICGPSACVAICSFSNFGPNIFCNFQICDLLTQICCGLKTSANLQILYFLLTNTYLKCSNSNFYERKNSAKQTSRQLIDSFAIKGGNFVERCLILSVLWWKICGFAICGLAHQQNLQICNLQTQY